MPVSFVFDANRCTGCQACQLACVIENGLDLDAGWRQVHTFNPRREPDLPLFHLSLACNHCGEPACMDACPALAYHRDPRTGAVLIDETKCMGCGYCSWACPYDAPRMDRDRGVMTKCTFCNDRLLEGERPACAALCPTGALDTQELPAAELANDVAGFPASDLEPSIRIVPLRDGTAPPTAGGPGEPSADQRAALGPPATHRVTGLLSETPLFVFTLLALGLFAEVGGLWARRVEAAGSLRFALIFAATGGLAMLMGSLHLGRKLRAWRAVLGVARSWLSREILLFPLFVAAGTLFHLRPEMQGLGVAAIVAGLVTFLAIDRVYRYRVTTPASHIHSAGLLLAGLYVLGVSVGIVPLVLVVGIFRCAAYVARKIDQGRRGEPVQPIVSILRVAAGFGGPLIVGLPVVDWGFLLVFLGEMIDRSQFYEELTFHSPARQMAADLRARRAGSAA